MQGGLWHLWCACLPLLLACQEVMAEESAPKVSSEPSACHVSAHGKDHADASGHWTEQPELQAASA